MQGAIITGALPSGGSLSGLNGGVLSWSLLGLSLILAWHPFNAAPPCVTQLCHLEQKHLLEQNHKETRESAGATREAETRGGANHPGTKQ